MKRQLKTHLLTLAVAVPFLWMLKYYISTFLQEPLMSSRKLNNCIIVTFEATQQEMTKQPNKKNRHKLTLAYPDRL